QQIVTDSQRARYMRRAARIMHTWSWLACVDYYQLRSEDQPDGFSHGVPRTSYEWFINGYALLSRDWQATASLRMFAALNLRKAPWKARRTYGLGVPSDFFLSRPWLVT